MIARLIISFCLISVLCISCSDDNPANSRTITGSGTLDTEERTVTAFKSVNLQAVGDVHLTKGPENSVMVTVDDNVMAYILTTVQNGELVISASPIVKLSQYDLTVEIMMTDLENVTLVGVGNIDTKNTFQVDTVTSSLVGVGNINLALVSDFILSSHTGTGNFVYSGTVGRHQIAHAGVGNVEAFSFITDTTIIDLVGVGNISIYANDLLDVNVSGSGNVLYKGQPTLIVSFTGEGQLIDSN